MNRISQNKQMDFIIRYWNGNTNKVAVRYLGSEFLGHVTAVDLLTHFKQGISQLDPKRLLQVSMDGPNVNWKFYTDLTKERNSEELPQLLNIGSCGLHIVHGGLQKGVNESGWKLGHLMRSLWQLFHDTPAWREDFVKLSVSTVFPLKFCPHRWVEDVVVAERAHQMWPNIKKYVSSFRATPKKAPQTASYATIKEACEDPLTVTKLKFFISVAKQLQPFLLKFQTDAPMAPFLGQSLKYFLLTLMGRFIKKDVLEQADLYPKLAAIDPCDKKNQVHCKYVEFGFAAPRSLKSVTDNKTISELAVLTFKTECVQLPSAMTAKLIERCPLKYPLVTYLFSLNPPKMISSVSDVTAKLEKILQILIKGNWCSAGECDELLSKYKAFLVQMKQDHAVDFRDFTPDSRQLDTFLGTTCRITSSLPSSGTSLKCFSQFRMAKLPSSVGTLLIRICSLRTFTRRLL